MSLTPKQEKFCQCIVSGMSGKDSYKAAYNTNGTDGTVNQEVVKLLAREDIQERIKTLQKPIIEGLQGQALSEYERLKALAWERIDASRDREDDAAIARYMDILNKMLGNYVNINKTIDDTTSSLDALDVETLKKLAGNAETV